MLMRLVVKSRAADSRVGGRMADGGCEVAVVAPGGTVGDNERWKVGFVTAGECSAAECGRASKQDGRLWRLKPSV